MELVLKKSSGQPASILGVLRNASGVVSLLSGRFGGGDNRERRPAGGKQPRRKPVAANVRRGEDHFGKFLIVSLALHAVLLAGGAIWMANFRGPELTLAQGAVSLELISLPGQDGSAATAGEGVAQSTKSQAVTREEMVEVVEDKHTVKMEEQATIGAAVETLEESPVPIADKEKRTVSQTKTTGDDAATPAPPQPKKDVATTDAGQGHGKKPAQSGATSPGMYQPGTPGGSAAAAVRNPTPRYPEAARKQGVEGVVILRLMIDTIGKVRHAEVVRSSGRSDFDRAAVDTIEKQWRYRPALSFGRPVESLETVRVCFVLGEA